MPLRNHLSTDQHLGLPPPEALEDGPGAADSLHGIAVEQVDGDAGEEVSGTCSSTLSVPVPMGSRAVSLQRLATNRYRSACEPQ